MPTSSNKYSAIYMYLDYLFYLALKKDSGQAAVHTVRNIYIVQSNNRGHVLVANLLILTLPSLSLSFPFPLPPFAGKSGSDRTGKKALTVRWWG